MKSALLIALGKASKAPSECKPSDVLADLISEYEKAPDASAKARTFRAMMRAASADDTQDED